MRHWRGALDVIWNAPFWRAWLEGLAVLVSQTVNDLVAGSGLTFEPAGEHELKGVPETWRPPTSRRAPRRCRRL
jgi:hypothetical protein